MLVEHCHCTACSAGVGRTGTLVTVDVELQRAQKEGMVDPFNYVLQMRQQRNHMVQTEVCTYYHDTTFSSVELFESYM